MTARISRRHSLVVVPSILAATHQHHHHRCLSSSVSSSSSITTLPSLTFAPITSFGFSGGGFLASYHLGAAHLLVQQGWLLKPGQVPPPTHTNTSHNHDHHHHIHRDPRNMIITGVSAGSLVVAAVAAGTNLEEGGLEACQLIAQRAKQMGGYLDCLKPGFSLVDQVEDVLPRYLKQALGGGGGVDNDDDDYDNDLFLRRIDGGRLLRIGLTDHRAVFPPIGYNPNAYVYVDGYRNIDDVVAACILSCFVPGLTGPATGAWSAQNGAVRRAYERMQQMAALGYIKQGTTGQPIMQPRGPRVKAWQNREAFWDGGLVNVFPTVDDNTVIVSPIAGNYGPHRAISPNPHNSNNSSSQTQEDITATAMKRFYLSLARKPLIMRFNPRAQIYLSHENARTFRHILLSSDDHSLQQRFQQGYDEAHRFLNEHGLLRTFQVPSADVNVTATPPSTDETTATTSTTATAKSNNQRHAA